MTAIWHVTTAKKLARYQCVGRISPPVRAWKSESAAARFSRQTGRRIILRLVSDPSFRALDGHRGEAVISARPYALEGL